MIIGVKYIRTIKFFRFSCYRVYEFSTRTSQSTVKVLKVTVYK